MKRLGTRRLFCPLKCAVCTISAASELLSNGTGKGSGQNGRTVPASNKRAKAQQEPAPVATNGPKNRGQNEDQGQQPQVDGVVPGSRFCGAALFRPGTSGGICPVRFGIRGHRLRIGRPLHASPRLGGCGGEPGQQPASGSIDRQARCKFDGSWSPSQRPGTDQRGRRTGQTRHPRGFSDCPVTLKSFDLLVGRSRRQAVLLQPVGKLQRTTKIEPVALSKRLALLLRRGQSLPAAPVPAPIILDQEDWARARATASPENKPCTYVQRGTTGLKLAAESVFHLVAVTYFPPR